MEEKKRRPISWLRFVGDKHPISVRTMREKRLAEKYPAAIAELPVSALRPRSIHTLDDRLTRIARTRAAWHYSPMHFPEGMPAFIAHCNACAVPYRLHSFTLDGSPLKAIKYLTMRASVLITRIPALGHYGDAIQWVEQGDGESYARALDKPRFEQCNSSFIEIRRSAVLGDSHELRVDQFLQIVLKEN
jgi:hypothetical protein